MCHRDGPEWGGGPKVSTTDGKPCIRLEGLTDAGREFVRELLVENGIDEENIEVER